MAQKETSQTQNFAFGQSTEAALGRMRAFWDEMDRMGQANVERTRTAVDEMARLTKETLDYQTRLATEWRNTVEEGVRTVMGLGRS
jgi:hypothetical protein